MRAVPIALILLGMCCAVASPLPRDAFPWHLSGDDFVAQVSGQPGTDKWHQRPQDAYAQRYAEGYQAGVVDATQGALWCAPPGMKPSEVDDRIWPQLRRRAGTMHGSAGRELLGLYIARFPCPNTR